MILDFSRSGDRATAKAITLTCVSLFFRRCQNSFFDDDLFLEIIVYRVSFVKSRHVGTHEYFRALLTHSLSLSLSPILLQYRDVQETCVKLGFLYPNAKTSDPVQRRADCVTMFRVVGCTCASTLFWCLALAFSRLFCLSLSLSLSRARVQNVVCANDGVLMPLRCVLTRARLHILRATQVPLDVQICLGARKTSLAETWDDPARLGKRPRGERRSHVENLRRGRIRPPLCLL